VRFDGHWVTHTLAGRHVLPWVTVRQRRLSQC
jgi:hypothetical protein